MDAGYNNSRAKKNVFMVGTLVFPLPRRLFFGVRIFLFPKGVVPLPLRATPPFFCICPDIYFSADVLFREEGKCASADSCIPCIFRSSIAAARTLKNGRRGRRKKALFLRGGGQKKIFFSFFNFEKSSFPEPGVMELGNRP